MAYTQTRLPQVHECSTARKRMLALERGYAAQVGANRWAEVRSTLETLFGDD